MPILPKKFPGPVAKPMTPFFIAGAIIMYGVNAAQNAMMDSSEFRLDPRNPNAAANAKADANAHH